MAISHDLKKIVKGCLKNKISAQKELYEYFAPGMLGICFRYTKNLHDAEDVLQEGFLKVFYNLQKYRSDGDLGGWIRSIMVNTALTYLKTNRRYQNEMFFEGQTLHQVSDENPAVKIASKELAHVIRQLPTGYQTIFNLYAIEGYSHQEIAEMLGISEGTSRSQYARARKLLIQWLKETSVEEKGGLYGK